MTSPHKSVLIVEDQFLISEYLRVLIEEFGFDVCGVATTADQAVAMAKTERPDIVLLDMRLVGDRDGVDAAKEITQSIDTRFIYLTGSSEPSAIRRINEDRPFRILIKPVDPAELHSAIMAAAA